MKVKAYLSHPITGKFGTNCKSELAQQYMKINCQLAIEKANKLRKRFPELNIYVPAESEPFVGRTYTKGYLDVNKILEIDCEILETCDILIIAPNLDNGISKGMIKEILRACDKLIPIFMWNDFTRIKKFTKEKYDDNTKTT